MRDFLDTVWTGIKCLLVVAAFVVVVCVCYLALSAMWPALAVAIFACAGLWLVGAAWEAF